MTEYNLKYPEYVVISSEETRANHDRLRKAAAAREAQHTPTPPPTNAQYTPEIHDPLIAEAHERYNITTTPTRYDNLLIDTTHDQATANTQNPEEKEQLETHKPKPDYYYGLICGACTTQQEDVEPWPCPTYKTITENNNIQIPERYTTKEYQAYLRRHKKYRAENPKLRKIEFDRNWLAFERWQEQTVAAVKAPSIYDNTNQ